LKFRTIVADPPWKFDCWSKALWSAGNTHDRRIEHHYETQEINWIRSLPVPDVAAEDCVLFLWATWPMLPEALETITAWGFEYKTLGFDWVKKTACNLPRINLGYWTRANTEPCLLATRGKPKRLDKGVAQVIVSGIGEHSEKPEEMYNRVERLVDGPYLEMFHRPRNGLFPPRPNWTFIGNAVTGRDIAEDIRILAALPQPEPIPLTQTDEQDTPPLTLFDEQQGTR